MKTKMSKNLASVIFACYATLAISAPHWDHDEQEGWGAIRDSTQSVEPLMFPYATCSIGKHQSPVDLAAQNHAEKLATLKIKYSTDKPIFYNSGHGVQVNTSDEYPGYLEIGEEIYPLIQFHFHEPSEHVIADKQFSAELHFVHVRDDGKMAVLGVLIEEGLENPIVQTILDNVPVVEGAQNDQTGLQFNPESLLPRNTKDYFSLAGSLTTPPCSEGINWLVLSESITISGAQLAQLKTLYSANARHIQDLNGRSVSQKN